MLPPFDSVSAFEHVGDSTAHRLLEGARRLLAAEGLSALTTRRLAEAAQANVAAVNYHFRSKDALVEAVLAEHLEGWFLRATVQFEEQLVAGPTPRAALRRVLAQWLADVADTPRMYAAHLEATIVRQEYDPRLSRSVQVFLDGISDRLATYSMLLSTEQRRARVAAAWSAVLLLGLGAPVLDAFLGEGVGSVAGRERLAEALAGLLLPT